MSSSSSSRSAWLAYARWQAGWHPWRLAAATCAWALAAPILSSWALAALATEMDLADPVASLLAFGARAAPALAAGAWGAHTLEGLKGLAEQQLRVCSAYVALSTAERRRAAWSERGDARVLTWLAFDGGPGAVRALAFLVAGVSSAAAVLPAGGVFQLLLTLVPDAAAAVVWAGAAAVLSNKARALGRAWGARFARVVEQAVSSKAFLQGQSAVPFAKGHVLSCAAEAWLARCDAARWHSLAQPLLFGACGFARDCMLLLWLAGEAGPGGGAVSARSLVAAGLVRFLAAQRGLVAAGELAASAVDVADRANAAALRLDAEPCSPKFAAPQQLERMLAARRMQRAHWSDYVFSALLHGGSSSPRSRTPPRSATPTPSGGQRQQEKKGGKLAQVSARLSVMTAGVSVPGAPVVAREDEMISAPVIFCTAAATPPSPSPPSSSSSSSPSSRSRDPRRDLVPALRVGRLTAEALRVPDVDVRACWSFSLPPGRVTLLLGESGAGKSRLLDTLAGVDTGSEWERLELDGEPLGARGGAQWLSGRRDVALGKWPLPTDPRTRPPVAYLPSAPRLVSGTLLDNVWPRPDDSFRPTARMMDAFLEAAEFPWSWEPWPNRWDTVVIPHRDERAVPRADVLALALLRVAVQGDARLVLLDCPEASLPPRLFAWMLRWLREGVDADAEDRLLEKKFTFHSIADDEDALAERVRKRRADPARRRLRSQRGSVLLATHDPERFDCVASGALTIARAEGPEGNALPAKLVAAPWPDEPRRSGTRRAARGRGPGRAVSFE